MAFEKIGSMTTNTISKQRKKQEPAVMAELDQRLRRLNSLKETGKNTWTEGNKCWFVRRWVSHKVYKEESPMAYIYAYPSWWSFYSSSFAKVNKIGFLILRAKQMTNKIMSSFFLFDIINCDLHRIHLYSSLLYQ